MSWNRYAVAWRLLSPLHVGSGRVGNLDRTRRYVPGRNVWAALTAVLARRAARNPQGEDYMKKGAEVEETLRFGYFFPALAPDGVQPGPVEDYRLIDSYASTAVSAAELCAEKGLLHETEFISPFARPLPPSEVAAPVYLRGQIWEWNEGAPGWREALEEVVLGGERGYGWGRLRLVRFQRENDAESGAGGDSDSPVVALTPGPIRAHVPASAARGLVNGPVEAVTGWERNNSGGSHPWRMSVCVLCYTPECRLQQSARFRIDRDCLWRPAL